MNILLDTHILVWSVGDPRRLSTGSQELLEHESTSAWLSPISLWECLLFGERDRVTLEPSPLARVRAVLQASPFHEAPLNHEVAIRSRHVELPHDDPVDRFICATAAVYDLTLLTSDRRILEGRGYSVMAND